MHAGVASSGLAVSAIILGCLSFALFTPENAWTTVHFQVNQQELISVDLLFSPSEYCVQVGQNMTIECFEYSEDTSTSTIDSRIFEFVARLWCGCTRDRRFNIGVAMKQALCTFILKFIHLALVFVIFPLTTVATLLVWASVFYFKQESIVGKCLGVLSIGALLGLSMILFCWLLFEYHSMEVAAEQIRSNNLTWHTGRSMYLGLIAAACLIYQIWFSTVITKAQTKRYVNRRLTRDLKPHPLKCPANYA